MLFSESQSQRIRFIRFIAIGLIITTHISQELKSDLAQITNTGVQMFLVLAGFLQGQAQAIQWKKWAWKRLIRILPPFYIILVVTA